MLNSLVIHAPCGEDLVVHLVVKVTPRLPKSTRGLQLRMKGVGEDGEAPNSASGYATSKP